MCLIRRVSLSCRKAGHKVVRVTVSVRRDRRKREIADEKKDETQRALAGALCVSSSRMADCDVLAMVKFRVHTRPCVWTCLICVSRVKTLMARLCVGTVCLRVRSIRRAGKAGIAIA
jgi:hypothetical protein